MPPAAVQPSETHALAPATPVIIASATPSPTPVTHVVQAGDTLIGLAVKYGVSLEALQQANPNVQPEALSVGAVLVIPVSDQVAIVQAGAAPTPMPVSLSTPACYPLSTGAMYCFVEARNPGPVALEAVTARVILAGSDGLPLAEAVAYPALDVVAPGEAIPLAAWFPSRPDGVAAVGVAPVAALPIADVTSRYLPLEVQAERSAISGAVWTIAGEVRNASERAAMTGRLVLVLYDTAGAIVGYREQALAAGLAAGEARTFQISAAALGGQAARYSLITEGRP